MYGARPWLTEHLEAHHSMKQALQLKLSPQLTLTPQLKQSLKLLQLPSLDLEQEIQTALDANPLLERVEKTEIDESKQSQESATSQIASEIDSVPQPIAEAADPSVEIERSDHLIAEQNLAQSFETQRIETPIRATHNRDPEAEFTQFIAYKETLSESLGWQVQMTNLSQRDKLILGSLIDSLDNEGYLTASPEEIVNLLDPGLEIDEDELGAMLNFLKTLEPVGVGACDLKERLLILLDYFHSNSRNYDLAKKLLQEHLALLGTHDYSRLKKQLQIDDETLAATLEIITDLNPRITTQFSSHHQDYVVPDVIVKKQNNQWVAQLNSENQTKLRINRTYSELLKGTNKNKLDKQGSEFIQNNLIQAKAFIKGLMGRYDTLLLVAQSIVERQQGFFEGGDEEMQAMTLADIAEDLDLHESTISRATSGKYLLSTRGVYELKYFFSTALNTTDGTVSSSTAIRSLIKKMVAAESKKKPLSDSKITKELEQRGHIIARRTVAKYRESMHIAPSNQRKSLNH